MFTKIFLFLLTYSCILWAGFSADKAAIKNALLNDNQTSGTTAVFTESDDGLSGFNRVLEFITQSLSTFLFVIAVGMFLFIGIRLVAARWNPEEFSKAIKSFIYAIVGIFIVSAAWAIVRIVAWFSTTSTF